MVLLSQAKRGHGIRDTIVRFPRSAHWDLRADFSNTKAKTLCFRPVRNPIDACEHATSVVNSAPNPLLWRGASPSLSRVLAIRRSTLSRLFVGADPFIEPRLIERLSAVRLSETSITGRYFGKCQELIADVEIFLAIFFTL
jgi:hypothetical protein